MINIGINGMGRIGKNVFNIINMMDNVQVVAFNEASSSMEHLVYQLTNDTIHDMKNNIKIINDMMYIDGRYVHRFKTRKLEELEWGKFNVDVVIEATGRFLTKESCMIHIMNGAKKVIMSAPPKDDTKMYLMGVNENSYNNENIISNGSCTTNCLSPFLKVINDEYNIIEGLMCTIHSTTASQSILDSKNAKNWRLGRASMMNIIPSTTGAAKAVGKVIPSLNNKLTGLAYRVPTLNGSVVDLNITMEKQPTIEEITKLLEEKSSRYLTIAPQGCVSSDIIGNSSSSIVDIELTIKQNNMYKFVLWYDNEYGYSTRLVDLAIHISK